MKAKSKSRRMLAAVLAACIVFSTPVAASAADTSVSSENSTASSENLPDEPDDSDSTLAESSESSEESETEKTSSESSEPEMNEESSAAFEPDIDPGFTLPEEIVPVSDDPIVEQPELAGEIVLSGEVFTLGQGYFYEPQTVEFYEGENCADILIRAFEEEGINIHYSGTPESNFYLQEIEKVDKCFVCLPEYMEAFLTVDELTPNSDSWLGQFDYTSMSGWMYTVNNEMADVGMSDYFPEDGDVMRLQFTVSGYGADLGFGWGTDGAEMANKDEITRLLAGISADDFDKIVSGATLQTLFPEASTVGEVVHELKEADPDTMTPGWLTGGVSDGVTQENVDAVVKELNAALEGTPVEPDLDTIKKSAKSELDSYKDPADYDEAGKAALEQAISDGKTAIDAAKDAEAVKDALAAAKKAIDDIPTAAQPETPTPDPEQPPVDSDIPEDFQNDLWLQYDFKELKVGDTADIYPRRVPQIVGDAINNDVHRPNFNFEIISGDSIELTEPEGESDGPADGDKVDVKAVKPGVTIVKVTYDETEYKGTAYGATAATNAAYAVFAVSAYDSDHTGITIKPNTEIQPGLGFTSYDTIYYTEGDTVDYEFTPAIENADTVRVTCNGHEIVGNDGVYILPLENRSNIIGVTMTNEKGVKYYYQVMDARKISVNVENKTDPGQPLEEGDTATISFTGIANPVYKLATIYNPTWRGDMFGEHTDGTFVEYTQEDLSKETFKGICSQWDLATNNDFEVTFEEAGTFTFSDGKIYSEWWGSPLGADKDVYGQGDPNLGAPVNERYFSDMPDFTVTVAEKGDSTSTVSEVYQETGKYLSETVSNPTVGTIGGEWAVLGLARAEYPVGEEYFEKYIANVINKLEETGGVLDKRKYTEYSRVVLALTSIGYDVTDVGGYNLLEPLADYNQVVWQGINGPIWALIAFDSHDYKIPQAPEGVEQTTREKLIQKILDQEIDGGGWALSGKNADTDITAMAIQALAPYSKSNPDVKSAIDRALTKLSEMQDEFGGFGSVMSETNCESCAQVVVVLTALGINPDLDSRFVKNGNSVLDALLAYAVEGGGFKHTASQSEVDGMATEQGYYALAAYNRFLNGKTSLYDMSDVKIDGETDTAVTGVTLSPDKTELEVGKTLQLNAEVLPATAENKNVTFASSNPDIATVNETGLVTAVAEGSVTITVTTNEGGYTDTAEITVKPSIPVDPDDKATVTLSIDKKTINKGYVLHPTTVEITKGDTVWDVLQRELEERNIDYDYSYNEMYDSAYVISIDGDGEFDHGAGSGWMYNVDGIYPQYGCSQYDLNGGEKIEWRYTTNLGQDLDDGNGNGATDSTGQNDEEDDNKKEDEEVIALPESDPVKEYGSADGKGTWKQYEDGKWALFGADGKPLTGWQMVDGKWYHFQSTGVMDTGWKEIEGKTYYLNGSGQMQTGWFQVDGKWYCCDANGALEAESKPLENPVTSYESADSNGTWTKYEDGRWSFAKKDGSSASGWQMVDGKWYFFDGNAVMQTGWQKINGSVYYLGTNGTMNIGWQKVNGTWYYFQGNGTMSTGWQKINGMWYYMDSAGEMQTGWEKIGENWYYLNANGSMKTGWLQNGGEWYYLLPSGEMLTNGMTPDHYFVDAEGRLA